MKIIKSKIKNMHEKSQKAKDQLRKEVKNQFTTYIGAGLGLVAGLAWNDAIKTLIEYVFPVDKGTMLAKFTYAVILTLIVVLVSVYILRALKEEEEAEEGEIGKSRKKIMRKELMEAAEILKKGGVGIVATDTIYGIVASASCPEAVERMYKLKSRDLRKPFVFLIASLEDLSLFGIKLDVKQEKILGKFWPGKISVVLPCEDKKLAYLHRGIESLAFRMPDKKELKELLEEVGPLASSSVNPEGLSPAQNIKEAKKYFGEKIDFYLNGGDLNSLPSTLISLSGGKIKVLRKGGWEFYFKRLRAFF